MELNKKLILGLLITLFMLTFAACGKDNTAGTDNKGTTGTNNSANNTAPMSKEEYAKYLSERYDYYFDNDAMDEKYDVYDIYDESFDYTGTYNEFITGFTNFYGVQRDNLKAFKKDLETNVRKGTPEVDKLNDEIIIAIDKAIAADDKYHESFGTTTKDYGTLAKDEIIKGLRTIGRAPHEARLELDRLIDNAKDSLGID